MASSSPGVAVPGCPPWGKHQVLAALSRDLLIRAQHFQLFSTCPAFFQAPPWLTPLLWLWQGPGAPTMRLVTHSLESGRGRCPYSPHEPFTGLLVGKRSGEQRMPKVGVLGMICAGRCWQQCLLLLWSWAGAQVCVSERSHPAEPAPSPARDLVVPAQNHKCGCRWSSAHTGSAAAAAACPPCTSAEEGPGSSCAGSWVWRMLPDRLCDLHPPCTSGDTGETFQGASISSTQPTQHPSDPQMGSCILVPPVTSWAAALPSSGPGSMGLSRATFGRSRTRTTGYMVGTGAMGALLPAGGRLGPALGPELSGLVLFTSAGGGTDEASAGTQAPARTLQPEHQEWGSAMGLPLYPQHLTLLPRAVPQGQIRAQGHVVLFLPPAEPAFVGAYAIPDTYNPHDDKVYIFFRETAMEAGQWERRHIHARVARVCKVSHQRPAGHGWVSHQVGFTSSGPSWVQQQDMRVTKSRGLRAEGDLIWGWRSVRCGGGSERAEPACWCSERRWREAQPHQPLEHVPQGPPGVLHPWAPRHRDTL